MSTTQEGTGRLSRCLAAAAEAEDVSQGELTVLSSNVDPYRLDNTTGHRNGAWFAAQVADLLGADPVIHLRGLHYAVASAGDIPAPEGKPYTNTDRNWVFLCRAAKAARWLGYVAFDRIKDERNQRPEIFVPETRPASVALYHGWTVSVPSPEEAMPGFGCAGSPAQPYRIILVGEKSSLGSVLLPVARKVGGELLLPTGEASDTMIAELAARAIADGRPAVVLYFSDFDPAGHQMPISFARKLQALRDLNYSDLDIQVHPVALTLDQVRDLRLPSTPLKDTERRADHWRTVHGHEQTEIDALAALRPAELREIADAAIRPFYDETLGRRVEAAEQRWRQQVLEQADQDPRMQEIRTGMSRALQSVIVAVEAVSALQREAAIERRRLSPPPFELPHPVITQRAPQPLFSTEDDYVRATRRLKAHKALKSTSE